MSFRNPTSVHGNWHMKAVLRLDIYCEKAVIRFEFMSKMYFKVLS